LVSDINDDYLIPPDLDGPLYEKLRQIIITKTDVDDISRTLDTSKAISLDMLNPRFLKEASSILKYPRCIRERPFNLKRGRGRVRGGGYVFLPKQYSDSQCC
jgi:hypothetical protein